MAMEIVKNKQIQEIFGKKGDNSDTLVTFWEKNRKHNDYCLMK